MHDFSFVVVFATSAYVMNYVYKQLLHSDVSSSNHVEACSGWVDLVRAQGLDFARASQETGELARFVV